MSENTVKAPEENKELEALKAETAKAKKEAEAAKKEVAKLKKEAEAAKKEAEAEALRGEQETEGFGEGGPQSPLTSADSASDPMRRVPIRLFKDNNKYKEPLYVSVNGYNAQIQRGVVVEVPFYVAKHIEEMQQQDENTAAMIEILTQEYEQKKDQLN